jgi:hypothetical protein
MHHGDETPPDEEMQCDEHGDELMDAQLRAAMLAEPMDTTALDSNIRKQIAAEENRRSIQRGKWIAAAAFAALLAIAVGGYWFFPNRGAAAMCADAARDHRVEVKEHQRRTWLTDAGAIGALAARRGLSAPKAEAMAPMGYRLERGKLCRLGGRVFLHLVYSNGVREFSLYLRDSLPSEEFLGTPRRAMAGLNLDLGAEHVAQVPSARFTALVVTDESQDAARDIARFTAKQL